MTMDRHAGWRAGEKRKTWPTAIALVIALLAALVLVTVVHGIVMLFGQPVIDMRL